MNYPKPSILKVDIGQVAEYIHVPQYAFGFSVIGSQALATHFPDYDRFSGDGFVDADNDWRERPQQERIVINIINDDAPIETPIKLFGAYKDNKMQPNCGNPRGIIVTGGEGKPYIEILHESETSNNWIGQVGVRIKQNRFNFPVERIFSGLRLSTITKNPDTDEFHETRHALISTVDDFRTEIRRGFVRNFPVSNFSEIELYLPNGVEIELELYPEFIPELTDEERLEIRAQRIERKKEHRRSRIEAKIAALQARMR